MTTLSAQKREKSENAKTLRENGFVPAVVYGPKQDAVSLSLKEIDFIKAYKEAGESTVITLNDGTEDYDVLVQEVAVDPVKSKVQHVDFYAIEKGKKVEVAVPLTFVGEAPAEKNLGGVLMKQLHEIEIQAMPKNLPHEIEVSIDSLVDFDTHVYAKDVVLPEGVELMTDPEELVVFVQEHKEEEIDEDAEAPDLDSIEVTGEKKTDDEEGATEEKAE